MFDASIPDASVGIGGAEQNTQETGDGTNNTVCAVTRDCERGFTCNHGKCTYSGYRVAKCEGGCGGTGAVLAFPLLLLWRRRPMKR